MAFEYVARAYTILYLVEHTEMCLRILLLLDYSGGFPYIQEVYALITDHERMDLSALEILGIEGYGLQEEQVRDSDGRIFRWQFLDVLVDERILDDLVVNGFQDFGSETGQVLYLYIDDSKFLVVDLGCAVHWGWPDGTRQYFRTPIEE